jgi:hypothetical protein
MKGMEGMEGKGTPGNSLASKSDGKHVPFASNRELALCGSSIVLPDA